jgi:hypothetical protein
MGHMYGQRLYSWLDELAAVVSELEMRESMTAEEIFAVPEFATAVVAASRAAQATHDKDKIAALRNGLRHTLGPDAPAVDEQARFFRLVDEYTATHLRVLGYLRDPPAAFEGRPRPNIIAGARSDVLVHALPEFDGREDWLGLIVGDLVSAQLVKGPLSGMVSEAGLYAEMTTALGVRFLDFIGE